MNEKMAEKDKKVSNIRSRRKILGIVGIVMITIVLISTSIFIFLQPVTLRFPGLITKEVIRETSPDWEKPGKFWVTYRATPNIYEDEKNEVQGIVLHHTAYKGGAEWVVRDLCNPKNPVSCHVVIDKDGTRYVLAPPEAVTWHAGFSKWGDRFRANTFMIGIEFQGNTLVEPLTEEQIESAVEYMQPIIDKYGIKAKNIVTHQMIRDEYRAAKPKNKRAYPKVDITQEEYARVLKALEKEKLLRK